MKSFSVNEKQKLISVRKKYKLYTQTESKFTLQHILWQIKSYKKETIQSFPITLIFCTTQN